jgi:hypothetical protein
MQRDLLILAYFLNFLAGSASHEDLGTRSRVLQFNNR